MRSDEYSITLFDRFGHKITDIDPSFGCMWARNDVGKADFTLAASDPKATESNLRIGNLVLFQHPRVGMWGGMIAYNDGMKWTGDGKVAITCLSAEYMFNRRRGPKSVTFKGSAGDIFGQLIDYGNNLSDMLVRRGNIDTDGIDTPQKCSHNMLNDIWKKVMDAVERDWWFEPVLSDDKMNLSFLAHLQKKQTVNLHPYILREGINIESPGGDIYTRDGVFINDLAVIGNGTGDTRPAGFARDETSIGLCGLWQGSEDESAEGIGHLTGTANKRIKRTSVPQEHFMLTVLESDDEPDAFIRVREREIVHVLLYSAGFGGVEKDQYIIARAYDTDDNKLVATGETLYV